MRVVDWSKVVEFFWIGTELKLKYPSEIFLRVNDDNYEASINKVLEIDESNLRGEIINKFINNRQIEHTPRIRQDVGKVYFLLDYGKYILTFDTK